ncbi:12527_t:CDS:1 [Racocetra fulgida]|uniref:12527_t:CDS:1 n=1 Tax=Racocetra fulgida TaxID=60492 RepID=A0A9N8VCE6_9GLOM|nr:12527_t:CDS:1 [Racocetra fulgida]
MNEIKDYVQDHLQQTPRVIWENIGTNYPNITEKQIYYWWLNLSQHLWKKDDNQIQSAIKIIESYTGIEIILTITDDEVTMISFGIIEIINRLGVNAVEIGIDATCMYSYLFLAKSFFKIQNASLY